MQNRNSSAMDIHKLPDCTDFIWRSNHMSKTQLLSFYFNGSIAPTAETIVETIIST